MEVSDFGNKDGAMTIKNQQSLRTGRRYSPDERAQAVRLVRALRDEVGTSHGTVRRVAEQLGYGVESVRSLGCSSRRRRRACRWCDDVGQGADHAA